MPQPLVRLSADNAYGLVEQQRWLRSNHVGFPVVRHDADVAARRHLRKGRKKERKVSEFREKVETSKRKRNKRVKKKIIRTSKEEEGERKKVHLRRRIPVNFPVDENQSHLHKSLALSSARETSP